MVADFYRALGWRVITNTSVAGQQVDILGSRYIEGMGIVTSIIECKNWARPINNQEVQNFIATVTSLRQGGKVQVGVMVGANGFTSHARATADHVHYVTLLEPSDLEADVLNSTFAMANLLAEYESQDIRQDFVSIDGRVGTWLDFAGSGNGTVRDVANHISNSVINERKLKFFLLADYGAGKTTLLRRIQYQLIRARLDRRSNRLPVFIALKNFHETQDLSLLIKNSIREDFLRDLSTESLWASINRGRFIFLFDGFDEMSDRSGEGRRAHLFARLLPALTSLCPAVLTSRPSLFIVKSELSTLIERWREKSAPLSPIASTVAQPGKNAARRHAALESLRDHLMYRMNVTMSAASTVITDLPPDGAVSIISLEPFTEEKIVAYLEQRLSNTSVIRPASVGQVLSFIQRVYDLSDLASRPLLLRLIVDTIVEGGIDVTDSALQFGPSGLYELYTTIKLDLDWKKGSIRRAILSREERRQFAVSVAMLMQERGTLQVPLADVLDILSEKFNETGGVDHKAFSPEEIATDFLTCSFLTIDSKQDCRFVHRSFQEFFVARTIQQRLKSTHGSLQAVLPTAVLYFLGGFAPTEPSLAERLWYMLKRSNPSDRVLRRNVLAAYLFTKPDHTSRSLRDFDLFDLSFGDLIFQETKFTNCSFANIAAKRLQLYNSRWQDIRFSQCSMNSFSLQASSISAKLKGCVIPNIQVDNSLGHLDLEEGVSSISLTGSDLSLRLAHARINSLVVKDCTLKLSMVSPSLELMQISQSTLELSRSPEEGSSVVNDRHADASWTATSSIVRVGSVLYSMPRNLKLQTSILQVDDYDGTTERESKVASVLPLLSPDSCMIALGHSLDYKTLYAGGQKAAQPRVGMLGVRVICSAKDELSKLSIWGIIMLSGDETPYDLSRGIRAVTPHLAVCTKAWLVEALQERGALNVLSPLRQNLIPEPQGSTDTVTARAVLKAEPYLHGLSDFITAHYRGA